MTKMAATSIYVESLLNSSSLNQWADCNFKKWYVASGTQISSNYDPATFFYVKLKFYALAFVWEN